MRKHPRIAHARAQVMSPIIANAWGWETREGTPDAWVDMVRDMFEPQRMDIVENALFALDYGHAAFEKVWEVRDGIYWLAKNKPLSVDTSHILVDKATGEFAGIRYGSGDEWLDRRKSWLFPYGGEAGELYGQSRLENLRETAWRDWLDCATQLYKLAEKASGIIPVVKTPAGTFKDSAGNNVTWKSNAETAINALRNARGVWFPTLAVPENRTPDNIALAKISLIDIDVLDLGDQGPAITAILSRMRHDEELMFAGYLRSPRTGMDATGGNSQADAVQHTDTDTTDPELVAAKIAMACARQAVDDVLAINKGEKARGAVWPVPAKMRDVNREVHLKILDAILADPMLRPAYIAQLDNDAMTTQFNIPKAAGKMIVLEDILPPIPPLRGQLPNDPNNPNPQTPPDPNAQAQQ
jgi:hypothetical protein